MANKIAHVIHRIVYYACFLGMVVLLLMMLLTTFDVAGRSFFRRPIPGAFEITQYMLAIMVLLGFAYAQQAGQHIRVDLFLSRMPPRAGLTVSFIFYLAGLAFLALLAWQGWEGGFTAIELKSASDILRIPTYPFEFIVAVSASLFFIEVLLKLITTIGNIKKGIAEKKSTTEAAIAD